MTGIVNSTGAKSGIIGTTVGTPSGGKVLQVKHDMISTRYWANNSETVIWTGDTLTLSSSSNKVLVLGDFSVGANKGGSIKLQYSAGGGGFGNITTADLGSMDNYHAGVAVMGWYFNFTEHISEMSALQSSFNYLHSPGNSTVQYRLSLNSGDSSYAVSINRRAQEADYGGLSWVTTMEISV